MSTLTLPDSVVPLPSDPVLAHAIAQAVKESLTMCQAETRLVGLSAVPVYEPGSVTAVVGPNGCGKSNILDALRWVLGEQSARTLRGKHMSDVIFAGSRSRKGATYAEVELTFDNRSGFLPIDQETVVVGRPVPAEGSGAPGIGVGEGEGVGDGVGVGEGVGDGVGLGVGEGVPHSTVASISCPME